MATSTSTTTTKLPEFGELLKSGKHSDFTVVCKDHAFKVHKAIITSKSKYFQVCIEGGFKEAEAGTVDLSEEDLYLIAKVISFLYTGLADTDTVLAIWPIFNGRVEVGKGSSHAFFELNIKLHKLADRFMMADLTSTVEDEMFQYPKRCGERCTGDWCDCLGGHETELQRNTIRRAEEFYDLAKLVYEELPNEDRLRARAIVAALETNRALPYPSTNNWRGDEEVPQTEEVIASQGLREDLSKLLKKHDLVAWNVARHYRSVHEEQVTKHARKLRRIRAMPRMDDSTTYGESWDRYEDTHDRITDKEYEAGFHRDLDLDI